MKLLTRIKSFIFGKPTEIELVEAALFRYRNETSHIESEWRRLDAPCCPGCFGGSRYHNLLDKIERVEQQLKRLKERKTNEI